MQLRSIAAMVLLSLVIPCHALEAADTALPPIHFDPAGIGSEVALSPHRQEVDTVYVLGGQGIWEGRFENPDGTPNWHGWTHEDVTAPDRIHWHNSDYLGLVTGAAPGPLNLVAYCGDESIPACNPGDPVGGYGNEWFDWLEWRGTVSDPIQPTTVRMDYYISHDVEDDYDFVKLRVRRYEGWTTEAVYDGQVENLHEQFEFTLDPEDYVGPANDQVQLRFQFQSDGGWSDQDCLYSGAGACQLDDVEIRLNGVLASFDDFQDGGLGSWEAVPATGVGDFSQLIRNLHDLDLCVDNYSWQLVFIDDGEIVPELPGTECISWCYGSDGWIVNNTGGLRGPEFNLWNRAMSPVLAWPSPDHTGGQLRMDVYRHMEADFEELDTWPGVFWSWSIRSVNTGYPDDLESAPWRYVPYWLYFGGPDYRRFEHDLSGLLVSDATHIQVALECVDWPDYWVGTDGTPAPYFDNVAVVAYPVEYPRLTMTEPAQSAFPARGSLDLLDLQQNWCRFDPGRQSDEQVADMLFCEAAPRRPGATLTGHPRLYYKIMTNALFNGVRGTELGVPDAAGVISGFVVSDTGRYDNGAPIQDVWFVDLPDSGHLYPGDVVQYYYRVESAVGGVDPRIAMVPADTTGFGDFASNTPYNSVYTYRALPTVFSPTPGDQPKILFIEDHGGSRDGRWHLSLRNNGLVEGRDYDTFLNTNYYDWISGSVSSEVIVGYDVLLYSCGTNIGTIQPPHDPEILATWLEFGGKSALFTGDDLAYDLGQWDPNFLNNWIGVNFGVGDLRYFIENQTAPRVLPVPGNPVFAPDSEGWVADGGCPDIADIDGVTLLGNTVAIAEFANPAGFPGGYDYLAGTYRYHAALDDHVVYLPYDLQRVTTPMGGRDRDNPAPLSARALLLRDVLLTFGVLGGAPVDVPSSQFAFTAACYPNPFNPRTSIDFTLPSAGEVTLKIYDLRGACVRTLAESERFPVGESSRIWHGEDDGGARVASGMYFFELQFGGETRIGKMTMVK